MSVFMRRLLSDSPLRYCYSRVSCAVGEESLEVTDFGIPLPFQRREHNIVGFCNGLFCLEYDGDIIVLNVANGTYEQVPYPTISPVSGCPFEYCDNNSCTLHTSSIHHTIISVFGFGQDMETNEFKVVAQVITYFDAGVTYDGIFKQAYVYTLGKKDQGWTQFPFPQHTSFSGLDGYGVWVKGCCHWICHESLSNENGEVRYWFIIKLDLNTLNFSSIRVPDEVEWFTRPRCAVMELENSLGLIVNDKDLPKTLRIWLFVEDSREWDEKPTSLTYFFDAKCDKLLGYLNDIMVFEGLDGSHVLMYDGALNKFWKSELIRDLPGCMQLFSFFESTVELETRDFIH